MLWDADSVSGGVGIWGRRGPLNRGTPKTGQGKKTGVRRMEQHLKVVYQDHIAL